MCPGTRFHTLCQPMDLVRHWDKVNYMYMKCRICSFSRGWQKQLHEFWLEVTKINMIIWRELDGLSQALIMTYNDNEFWYALF